MKRSVLAALVAVVLALVGCVAVVLYVRGADARALAGQRAVRVLVVHKLIPTGTTGQQIRDGGYTEPVTVPAATVPVDALSDLDSALLALAVTSDQQPRQLLALIPELQLVPLPESEMCCGAAGSYNITQPAMAHEVGARKAELIVATGAQAVFAGNVGCLLQIGKHLRERHPKIWVAHPIDALWASYCGECPVKF